MTYRAIVLLWVFSGPAAAHAFLEQASPRVGNTVSALPGEVVLSFTQGIEPDFSHVEVTDASGASTTTGPAHISGSNPRQFAVPVHLPGRGTYTVIWHVTSVDTHKTQGKFQFTVGP